MLLASDFDKSKYLKAEDLKQDKRFRIKAVTGEDLKNKDGKTEKKLVVWFTNSDQGLILNKTNLRTLKAAFGDDTAGWTGKVIVLFPTMTDVAGKLMPCLRVRIPPPKAAAPEQPTAPQQPVTSGNGAAPPAAVPLTVAAAVPLAAAALTATAPAADPELDPDPVKPIGDDLDDEIPF